MTDYASENLPLTSTRPDVGVRIRLQPGEAAPIRVFDSFKATVKKHGSKNALYTPKGDGWKVLTFQQYYDLSLAFGKALVATGFKRYQSVNIIGFNSVEWFISNMGAIAAGGLAAGIYTTNLPDACFYISEHSEAHTVVVEDKTQLMKYKDICSKLPHLKQLVIYQGGVPEEAKEFSVPVYDWAAFLKLGESVSNDTIEGVIEAQKPNEGCTLIYTSGTTGPPKAVMISHDNLVWTANKTIETIGGVDYNDRIVSYLPLSHIAAQLLDIHSAITAGVQIYFAKPDALKGSLGATLKQVRPTVFFGVPRVWEKIMEKMQEIGKSTTGVKKQLATWAKAKGKGRFEMSQYGKSGGAPFGFGCAHAIVLSKVKAALGLDACRFCFTGAAPIAVECIEYFGSLDIHIFELFGQSECTGPQTMNIPRKWRVGSCGPAFTGTTMKLGDQNELIYCGRNTMMGYMKDEAKTKETIDEEGFLHSGDVAKIDSDGFMSITGRIKELIITAGGENIPPVLIEDAMKDSMKAIANCMVIGDKRKFLSMIIALKVEMDAEGLPTNKLTGDALTVSKEIGSTATTVQEAKGCEKWKKYLDDGVKRANEKSTSRAQRVNKWTIINDDFTVLGGELTPTLKLKRSVVANKYSDIIEEMYSGSAE